MTNKHHSVLVVESEPRLTRLLNNWLHAVEDDIQIDQVETTTEAKERLRSHAWHEYDLVIADEYLPGTDTGLELYRHCASEYPTLPFLMTAGKDLNAYIDREFPQEIAPVVLNPEDPAQGLPLIEQMLDQKPMREHEIQRDDQRMIWATALLASGFLTLAPVIQPSVAFILQNPPFTERFIIPPVSPKVQPKEEILAPPPPKKVREVPFDIHAVFTPQLRAKMREVLSRADEILAMSKND